MGVLLAILTVLLGVAVVASNSGDLGVQNARHALTLSESKQLYDAAYTGISEAIAERFQPRSNRYNFISSATTPIQGLSGRLYSDPTNPINDNLVATYRYMVFGGQNERNSSGTFQNSRVTETSILQPVFVVSKADACFRDFQPISGALVVAADGTVGCSSGTQRSLTLLARMDLSRAAISEDTISLISIIPDDTNITLSTPVFIPGSGQGTSLDFRTAWQGGSGSTSAASLTHVVVDNDGTVTTYPVTGSTLDITASGDLHETNTNIWFIFNDGIDFRSLYPGSGNLNECFTNSALQCGIHVERDETGGDTMNARLFPAFPAGNRVLVDADYPAYANGDTSAKDSWYKVFIPAGTIRDWYGNTSSAFTLTFKTPDPAPPCTAPVAQDLTGQSGTVDTSRPFTSTLDYSASTQGYNITANGTAYYGITGTGCNDTVTVSGASDYLEFILGVGNDSVNITELYDEPGLNSGWLYMNGGTGTDSLALPGLVSDWSTSADAYGTKYSLLCSGTSRGVFINSVENVTFNGAIPGCVPPPPPCGSTTPATASGGAGTYTYASAVPYNITVNNTINGYHIDMNNACTNNITISYPDNSGNWGGDVRVDGGSGADTVVLRGYSSDYSPASSPAAGAPYVCLEANDCGTQVCYDPSVETVSYSNTPISCTSCDVSGYEIHLEGFASADTININSASAYVEGKGGNDTINLGAAGNNNSGCTTGVEIWAGDGNDVINLNDTGPSQNYPLWVFGGNGNDTINAIAGDHTTVTGHCDGGGGDDTINLYDQMCDPGGGGGTDVLNICAGCTVTKVTYEYYYRFRVYNGATVLRNIHIDHSTLNGFETINFGSVYTLTSGSMPPINPPGETQLYP